MLRKLRIAFSVVCVIVCLLLIALWVKSYWRLDYYQGFIWTSTATNADGTPQAFRWPGLFVASRQGRFYIYWMRGYIMNRNGSTIRHSLPIDEERANLLRDQIGFELNDVQTPWLTRNSIASPYWAPLALAVGSALVPWFHWRFGLRTLLIATTLAALLLGAAVYAIR